jgi:hypothetical protein
VAVEVVHPEPKKLGVRVPGVALLRFDLLSGEYRQAAIPPASTMTAMVPKNPAALVETLGEG